MVRIRSQGFGLTGNGLTEGGLLTGRRPEERERERQPTVCQVLSDLTLPPKHW